MSSTSTYVNASAFAADTGGIRVMNELSIAHDGRYFHFDGHRYERLEDAIAYAQLIQAQPSRRTGLSAPVRIDVIEPPNALERQLMLDLSIGFDNGTFVFEGFRYDKLEDAANYARHCRQLGRQPH